MTVSIADDTRKAFMFLLKELWVSIAFSIRHIKKIYSKASAAFMTFYLAILWLQMNL